MKYFNKNSETKNNMMVLREGTKEDLRGLTPSLDRPKNGVK